MTSKINKKPSSLACTACRTKHLKCDSLVPVCSRCSRDGTQCQYIKSRRGFREPKRNESISFSRTIQERALAPNTGVAPFSHLAHFAGPVTKQSQSQCSDSPSSSLNPNANQVDELRNDAENSIDLYYKFVHPTHPIIIPRSLYIQDRSCLPEHLKDAMKLLGTHFKQERKENVWFAEQMLNSVPDDAFKVQTLLLSALTSFAQVEQQRGITYLRKAVALSLSIGLHRDDFANGEPFVFRESWRRTWWELYTIVGTVSVILPLDLKLEVMWNLTLPMNCNDYRRCAECPQETLGQMQDSFFMEAKHEYSSFAYKVEAVRILNRVLDINNDPEGATESQLAAAKASIASYILRLPVSKRQAICAAGETDEVMLFALMIIYLAEICLHLPRSGMSGIEHFQTSCWNNEATFVTSNSNIHRLAALRSSNSLFQLMSENTAFVPRSPCFTCPISLATVVQLLSYTREKEEASSQIFREHILLALSLLSRMGEVWPIAHVVRGQIARFAREVLGRSETRCEQPRLESAESSRDQDATMYNEQWFQDLVADPLVFGDDFELATIPI